MNQSTKSWVVCTLLSACVACATTRPAPAPVCTAPVVVRLEASEHLNPDAAGDALPTVVRLYQLRSPTRLETSDFQSVWTSSPETLGPDMVALQQLTLYPSQQTIARVALEKETQHLAGVAIFRQPTGTQWRSIVPLPQAPRPCRAGDEPVIVYRLDAYRVEGRSWLMPGDRPHALPRDVAPSRSAARAKP